MELDTIICGDCLEVLATIPDESVDLVFADPPFNIGKPYKDRRDNYREWCADWIGECFRVLKPTGSFYLMTLTRHLEWKMPIMARHGVFINLITWRNVAAVRPPKAFWSEYQPIMLYGKTQDYKFHRYAEIEPNGMRRWGGYSKNSGYKGQLKDRWDDIPFVYAGSIQHPEAILETGTRKKAHPCQMPERLVARAIKFSTDEGDVVLDPFAGSGTTAVAAYRLRRLFIGIELEGKYVKLAQRRLEDAKQTLFVGENVWYV